MRNSSCFFFYIIYYLGPFFPSFSVHISHLHCLARFWLSASIMFYVKQILAWPGGFTLSFEASKDWTWKIWIWTSSRGWSTRSVYWTQEKWKSKCLLVEWIIKKFPLGCYSFLFWNEFEIIWNLCIKITLCRHPKVPEGFSELNLNSWTHAVFGLNLDSIMCSNNNFYTKLFIYLPHETEMYNCWSKLKNLKTWKSKQS